MSMEKMLCPCKLNAKCDRGITSILKYGQVLSSFTELHLTQYKRS